MHRTLRLLEALQVQRLKYRMFWDGAVQPASPKGAEKAEGPCHYQRREEPHG